MRFVFATAAVIASMLVSAPPAHAQLFSIAALEHNESRIGQNPTNTRYCWKGGNQPCLDVEHIYGSEIFYDVKVDAEDYGLLHGQAFIYNSRAAGTPFDSQVLYSEVKAGFVVGYNDTWTIHGGVPGTTGTLQIGFNVTGYAQASSESSATALMRLTNLKTFQSDYAELSLPSTVVLSTDFRFGESFSYQLTLSGSAIIRNARGGYDTQQADINLANTAAIQQVSVFNQSGTPVDATFIALSGSSYLGVLPVPELSTTTLHALGLMGLFALLRRRTQTG